MRFIHQQADEISRYVESNRMHVTRCNYDGSSPPIRETPGAIEDMLRKSDALWGLALPYHLSVSTSVEIETLPLDKAVVKIEASGIRSQFLIVAYQDGGIISISANALPFQEHAKRADWWRPRA